MPTPTYTPLANITLGSGVTSVTFSSLAAGYRDYIIIASGMNTGLRVRLNGDTGANYLWVYMGGNGSTADSQSESGGNHFSTWYNGAYDMVTMQFLDGSATDKHKSVLYRSNMASSATYAWAGRWANTAAISTIQLYATSAFATGTTFALYGIAA